MSTSEQVKSDYGRSATRYSGYSSTPLGQLESQLIRTALGDCNGYTILDLGGGTGVHARQAIELGAAAIDLIDLSPEMLRIAEQDEESLGRGGQIVRFFEADASKPLTHLPLRFRDYDMVMANWLFSHADSREVLEGMFRNIGDHLKPGGRFVSIYDKGRIRVEDSKRHEKYGISWPWVQDIPEGVNYKVILDSTPPTEIEVTSLDLISSGSTELHENFGLTNVEAVPNESAEIVQKDPDFWKAFLDEPSFVVVKAVKKKG